MPEIQLGVSALIPEEYVRDMYQRLVLYKRISLASNDEEISRIKNELTDCYGILPQQAENLLQVINIRNQLKMLHGKKMGYDGRQMHIFLRESTPLEPGKVVRLFQKDNKQLRFTPDGKLFFALPNLPVNEILTQASLLLKMLAQ